VTTMKYAMMGRPKGSSSDDASRRLRNEASRKRAKAILARVAATNAVRARALRAAAERKLEIERLRDAYLLLHAECQRMKPGNAGTFAQWEAHRQVQLIVQEAFAEFRAALLRNKTR
jgi:hypothetical protein